MPQDAPEHIRKSMATKFFVNMVGQNFHCQGMK